MTALFGGSKDPPPVKPAPPAPSRSDGETQALAEAQRKKFGSSVGGRSLTMLTGGLGVPNDTMGASKKLGGG